MKIMRILLLLSLIIVINGCDTFGKNTISEKDKIAFWKKGLEELDYKIAREASRQDEKGYYITPSFENISIPTELYEYFTEKALRKYYDSFDFVSIKETFDKIVASDNISWYYGENYLSVNIHNYHNSKSMKGIIITIVGIGDYAMVTHYGIQNSDAEYICLLNQNTFEKLNNNKGNNRIRIKELLYLPFNKLTKTN